MPDEKRIKPMDEQAEFVTSFVDESKLARDPHEEVWDELEMNFLVKPLHEFYSPTRYPLDPVLTSRNGAKSPLAAGQAILKDPETHQAVMTIVSKLVLSAMGEPGFIKATKVGGEDIFKSTIASKLLEYVMRKEGHFWTMIEWVLGATLYGTGIMEVAWDYQEGPRDFRSVEFDPSIRGELTASEIMTVPTYDDVRYTTLDIRKFYPDPSQTMMSRMLGAAKMFRITEREALRRSENETSPYKRDAVNRAIESRGIDENVENQEDQGDELLGTQPKKAHPAFKELIGLEYFGEVPFKTEDGISHRVITVLSGETVRSQPWTRRIPFFDFKVTPRLGSFYGYSPAEGMRHDQDFADVVKMMWADATVRAVHGQPVVDKNRVPDYARLRRFRPDTPVPVDGDPRTAVHWNQYNVNTSDIGQMYSLLKGSMRESSGALGSIQGLGLGSKRFSASEAVETFRQALDRPGLWGQVLEREALPAVGKYTIKLYQTFLETSDDLQLRVGESEIPVVLGDIMVDFDLEFIGSRQEGGREQEIAAFREIVAASANPIIAPQVPWTALLRKWFEKIGAPEIAAMVGDPELMQLHLLLQLASQQNALSGNNNGELPRKPPVGALPAQLFGGEGGV